MNRTNAQSNSGDRNLLFQYSRVLLTVLGFCNGRIKSKSENDLTSFDKPSTFNIPSRIKLLSQWFVFIDGRKPGFYGTIRLSLHQCGITHPFRQCNYHQVVKQTLLEPNQRQFVSSSKKRKRPHWSQSTSSTSILRKGVSYYPRLVTSLTCQWWLIGTDHNHLQFHRHSQSSLNQVPRYRISCLFLTPVVGKGQPWIWPLWAVHRKAETWHVVCIHTA